MTGISRLTPTIYGVTTNFIDHKTRSKTFKNVSEPGTFQFQMRFPKAFRKRFCITYMVGVRLHVLYVVVVQPGVDDTKACLRSD